MFYSSQHFEFHRFGRIFRPSKFASVSVSIGKVCKNNPKRPRSKIKFATSALGRLVFAAAKNFLGWGDVKNASTAAGRSGGHDSMLYE